MLHGGSIDVHAAGFFVMMAASICIADPTASHYLKALMDAIFGPKRFRNELVWCYSGGGIPKRDYPRKHDIILRYSKGNKWTFNVERKAYKSNTQQVGKHSTYSGGKDIDLARGTPVTDWWSDIQTTTGWSPENTGYPTQKPLELYRRIIRASSNPGDIVFDPFAGCATTCVAAEAEGRQWVAADIWEGTLGVTQERLETLARPTGSGETSGLRLYPVVQRTEPLVRTDEGEISAPPLKSVFRKQSAPTMKREEMLAALIERDGLQCQGWRLRAAAQTASRDRPQVAAFGRRFQRPRTTASCFAARATGRRATPSP